MKGNYIYQTRTTTPAYERPLQVCVIYEIGDGISRLVGGNEVMGIALTTLE